MITITGLAEDKYQELVQKSAKSDAMYNEETGGYDITLSPIISAYIINSYENELSTIYLLSLGHPIITLKSSDFKRLSIV